jgi:hypothetical protein
MKYTIIFLFLLNLSSFSTLKDQTTHQCVSRAEVICSDNMLLCPSGYIDGCLTEETEHHQCVRKNDGPSCDIPMQLSCPENFHDGCESNQTITHECVPSKGYSCEDILPFSCPMGFQDACNK